MQKIVCYCKNISEATIVEAINNGANSLNAVKEATGACTGNDCKTQNPTGKCCSTDITKLLNASGDNTSCSCCGK